MSMFKSSEFLDEESVQAGRLDESLEKALSGDEPGVDYREDPELSELLAVGVALGAAADDVKSRPSFRAFHMRSRAAILQSTGAALVEKRVGILNSLWQKISRARLSLASAGVASMATLAIVFVFGSNSDTNLVSASVDLKEQSDFQMTSTMPTLSANVPQSQTDRPAVTTQNFSVISTPSQLTESVSISSSKKYVTTLEGVTKSLNAIVNGGDSIEVSEIRQLTDYLAQLGFDIRLNPPGNNNKDDVSTFQDVIAASVLALEAVNTEDPAMLSAVLAAKIVAEDSMGIATRYVNLNLASR